MKIINRTMRGMMLLMSALARFGQLSPEVAMMGGFGSIRNQWRSRMKHKGSSAAQHKRAATKLKNLRARSAK